MPRESVTVVEVGLRDGLQMLPQTVPTEHKLEWLNAEHASGLLDLDLDPDYDNLRADPRFHDLARRMNLAAVGMVLAPSLSQRSLARPRPHFRAIPPRSALIFNAILERPPVAPVRINPDAACGKPARAV